VTAQSTQPPGLTDRCRDQQAAVEALLNLVSQHPTLPAAYVSVYVAKLNLQLDSPPDFEAWREVLEAPASDVRLHVTLSSVWLTVDTTVDGIPVHLSGFNLPVSYPQAQAPRDRSAVTA